MALLLRSPQAMAEIMAERGINRGLLAGALVCGAKAALEMCQLWPDS